MLYFSFSMGQHLGFSVMTAATLSSLMISVDTTPAGILYGGRAMQNQTTPEMKTKEEIE